MPLYDYQCENCSHEEEHLQRHDEARLTVCPQCEESSYKRKASAPAFMFKGGGWYKDLYGSAKSGSAKPDSAPKSDSTASSSTASSSTASSKAAPASSTPKTESKSTAKANA